jgi:uncharacterized repeat protein (TIGR01451 family)
MRKYWRPAAPVALLNSGPPGGTRHRRWPRLAAVVFALTTALGLLAAAGPLSGTARADTLQVTTTSLPPTASDIATQLTATGGTGPYTWSVVIGSLPPDFVLTSSGILEGDTFEVQAPGTYTFTVQVTDAGGLTATQQLSQTVYLFPTITSTSLPDATADVPYSAQLTAIGGVPPLSFGLWPHPSPGSGPLPPGLTVSSDGTVSGTPTESGTFTVTMEVADSAGDEKGNDVTLTVNAAPPAVTTSSLPDATAGTAFSQTLTATGGLAPFTWSLSTGSVLPAGVTLDAAGTLSGTPANAGNYTFTVQAADSESPAQTATEQLTLTVNPAPVPPLAVTTSSLPGGTAGTSYRQTLSASGGKAPYTWSLAGGSLPAGLSLSRSGIIAGMPRAAGASTFTVKVTDAEKPAKTATVRLSITVVSNKADVTVAVRGPASAKAGRAVTDTITVTNNGPVAASKVKVSIDSAGLAGVKASAGGSTKSVILFGVTLAATTWSVASLAPGQTVTFTITGTVPARGVKTATAAGLALSATADPNLLNNAGLTSTNVTS